MTDNRKLKSGRRFAKVLGTRKSSISICLVFAAGLVLPAPGVHAESDDAGKILKAMSDFMASQKTISATLNTDIEVLTSDLQKIQFDSSGQLLLSRPDKLRVSRTGGYADVEFVFDGKTATILGKNINAFAQLRLTRLD